MDISNINTKSFLLGGVVAGALLATALAIKSCSKSYDEKKYSIPDQPLRFAQAIANNNARMLDIESLYQSTYVQGKVVLVTGRTSKL